MKAEVKVMIRMKMMPVIIFAACLGIGPVFADDTIRQARDPVENEAIQQPAGRVSLPGLPQSDLAVGTAQPASIAANTPVEISSLPALSTTSLVADDTTQYTVSMTTSDGDGYDDIVCLRVLFNYNESGYGGEFARGYMAWGATDEVITQYGGTWAIADATGGGRWGYMTDGWGSTNYITPLACATATGGSATGSAGTRTATWTFTVKPAWASNPITNDADGWAADTASTVGWLDNPDEFDVLAYACAYVSPTPRSPVVTNPSSTSLDLTIDPSDPPGNLYAIRLQQDKRFVQADGTLGSFPVFQSPGEWGTTRVTGLRWSRSYSFAARSLHDAPGYCPSDYGPLGSGSTQAPEVVARPYYGARFEPQEKIIHGAGQTYIVGTPQDMSFNYYTELLGPFRSPLTFMAYASIGSSQGAYDRIRGRLEDIQTTYGKYVVPQIGFSIASGEALPTEPQLDALVDKIRSLDRPVFLRIGGEFNGTWYDPMYNPPYYAESFRMVTQRLRDADLPVATLWCAYPGWSSYYGNWEYVNDFYPGDEYVDWWSVDVFSPGELTNGNNLTFLAKADLAGKPVMIGETTPRFVGADDDADWETWFVPFFDLIHSYRCIKGHTYINYDWGGTTQWPTWGDARLETGDPYVRDNYLAEMDNPIYVHATSYIPVSFLPPSSAGGTDADLNRYQ